VWELTSLKTSAQYRDPWNAHTTSSRSTPDGTRIWKATIAGHEAAIAKRRELAGKTTNEVQVLHLPTKALVAVLNVQKS
jgi:hypothetical protein